ncbi:GntR family transcriptional regulator [Streptomyces sp. NPDC048521]|uniref:GntR family transcriptional regulator n=1 Tax=Streptomyces sp. NPDC048521 TaxID=3365566 RepID=UPI00371CF6D8
MTHGAEGSKQPASARVAGIIADRILDGTLAPGTRIVQDELAAELNTSRIPVREALRLLESRGLVVLRANTGAWVSSMTRHDLEQSYEIRERIEPLLLADSLRHFTEEDVAELERLQDLIEANEDPEEFLRLDRRFHWCSYRRHRSPALAAIITRLWETTHHYRRALVRLTDAHTSWVVFTEHRLLIEAMRSREPQTASTILGMHINRTRLTLARHEELFEDGADA